MFSWYAYVLFVLWFDILVFYSFILSRLFYYSVLSGLVRLILFFHLSGFPLIFSFLIYKSGYKFGIIKNFNE